MPCMRLNTKTANDCQNRGHRSLKLKLSKSFFVKFALCTTFGVSWSGIFLVSALPGPCLTSQGDRRLHHRLLYLCSMGKTRTQSKLSADHRCSRGTLSTVLTNLMSYDKLATSCPYTNEQAVTRWALIFSILAPSVTSKAPSQRIPNPVPHLFSLHR